MKIMFEIGDRVRAVVDRPYNGDVHIGDEGIVCAVNLSSVGGTLSIGVDFDREFGGHSCMGNARDLHGWWLKESDIQFVEDCCEVDEPLSECFSTTDLSNFLCGNTFLTEAR